MEMVSAAWHNHDTRGLVCEITGPLSEEELGEARRIFARELGERYKVSRQGRSLIVETIPMWLYDPRSVYRRRLVTVVERRFNNGSSPRPRQ